MKRDFKCTTSCFVQTKQENGSRWSKSFRLGEIIKGVEQPPKHHEHHFQAVAGSEFKYMSPDEVQKVINEKPKKPGPRKGTKRKTTRVRKPKKQEETVITDGEENDIVI